jgi:hypothetical protein
VEFALDAGRHEVTVLPGRVAGARALTRQGHERALVLALDAERAVLVLLHAPLARARVGRPLVPTRALVGHDDLRGEAVVALLLRLAFPSWIGEPRCGENQD